MMNLNEFIEKYDFKKSIILLEGKRKVKLEDQNNLIALGRLLATHSQHMIFRSGNANGADAFFTQGVMEVAPQRMQLIKPYDNHRKGNLQAYPYSLDEVNLANEEDLMYESKMHKPTQKLVDAYAAGKRDRFSIKAAYIIRDTLKVLGNKDLDKATFAFFYEDYLNPKSGGTGHTMQVCERHQVPYLTQNEWIKFLNTI